MPNHIHLIVRQNSDIAPSKFISSVHTGYAIAFNKKYNSAGHLFQDRFKQKIISDNDYLINLIAYIHLNPVKAGICKFPKEYKWSSYLEYAVENKPMENLKRICDYQFIKEYGMKGQSFEEFLNMAGKISEDDAFED